MMPMPRTAALLIAAWMAAAGAAPTTVSRPGSKATAADLAVGRDGSIQLVWIERSATAGAPGGADLWFARSIDGGQSFAAPVQVNVEPGSAWGFPVARPRVSPGRRGVVHVFHAGQATDPASGMRFVAPRYARSTDDGQRFVDHRVLGGIPAGLATGDPANGESFGTLAADGRGGVFAYWIETRGGAGGAGRLMAAVSSDDGASFMPVATALAADVCPCCQPTALAADGRIYLGTRLLGDAGMRDSAVAVAPAADQPFGARVRWGGSPWPIDACPMKQTVVAVDGRRLYAASFDGGAERPGAAVSRSDDGGRSFGPAVPLHPGADVADAPALVLLGRRLVAAWHAKAGGERRVFLAVSRDRGRSFSAPAELPAPPGPASYPALAVRDGGVQVAWQQGDAIVTQYIDGADPLLR
jgi:hypothetical protein